VRVWSCACEVGRVCVCVHARARGDICKGVCVYVCEGMYVRVCVCEGARVCKKFFPVS
jgi:hypothetical protein